MNCGKCSGSMIKSFGAEAKMRMKLIKWNAQGMFAVCKSCGHENEITPELLKSVQNSMVFEVPQDLNAENNK